MDSKLSLNNFPVTDLTQEEILHLKEKNKQAPSEFWTHYVIPIVLGAFFIAMFITKIPALDRITPSWLEWLRNRNLENSNSYFENVFFVFLFLGVIGVFHYWRYRFRLLEDLLL